MLKRLIVRYEIFANLPKHISLNVSTYVFIYLLCLEK